MNYTINKIAAIVKGQLLQFCANQVIQYLLVDSRKAIFPTQSLFFALQGVRQDGHEFIEAAYEKGVRNFVVTKAMPFTNFQNANFIKVDDTLKALQALGQFHQEQFDLPVIGITGSNGKTIVKEWLYQLLQEEFMIVRSPRSYNSQLGVPLSLWQIDASHELGLIEVGVSKIGEMEKLTSVVNCNLGILTNIGAAHAEGFPSIKVKLQEKLRLFQSAATIFYCSDHALIQSSMTQIDKGRLFAWGRQADADLRIVEIIRSNSSATIKGLHQGKALEIKIPFQDEASIENAMHCWAVTLHLGIPNERIATRMQLLERVKMRLTSRNGINNCLVINDSYNSDLTSLALALNFLEQQTQLSKKTLILSDILESGQSEAALYKAVADLILEKQVQKVIGIGSATPSLKTHLPQQIEQHYYEQTQDFLAVVQNEDFDSEAILIKGARAFEFELIASRLAEKIHRTVLEVNIKSILHNLNVYSQYLRPDTKTMVMVKAAAYGSGSVEIARVLEYQNVDYLAVAYADEGVELRKAGIQLPILVLNPEEATFDTLLRYELEPEIYTIDLLKSLMRFLPDQANMSIHLKLETGMNRLGYEEEDLPQLIQLLKSEPALNIKTIFSHLAASEAAAQDAFTLQQIKAFESMYQKIATALQVRPIRHILNTSGIIRFPQYQFEMVRLGIGLYGVDSADLIQSKLKVVNSLKARVSQLRHVPVGETVGYGRKGKINESSKIATVSIGYADGLLRAASNGNYQLLIRGKAAPIVGNVCMDMCMVDVSDIDGVEEGDEVVVFGDNPTVSDLATACHTIPYEIFTHISNRVKRIYFEE